MDAYQAFLAGQSASPPETAARRLLAKWRAEWDAERPQPTGPESEALLDALNQRLERMAERIRDHGRDRERTGTAEIGRDSRKKSP